MKIFLLVLALVGVSLAINREFLKAHGKHEWVGEAEDGTDPLILTNYLSNPALGRQLAAVTLPNWKFPSYSGFFTVNATAGGNTFFWFFPSQDGNPNAPVLVWLQGGPGVSSMFGLFTEMGPFVVNPDLSLSPQPYSWNQNYSMIFIDNPVGVGFSFVMNADGFVHDQIAVGECLYHFVTQFFIIFPMYQKNPFYVCGESYAGKYVPAMTWTIDKYNRMNPPVPINLYGMSVGDGIIEPIVQFTQYSDLLYEVGMIDEVQREFARDTFEKPMVGAIEAQDWLGAFWLLDAYINGDFTPRTWFNNITGTTNYLNFLDPVYPNNPFPNFLNAPTTRAALHVGSVPYFSYNSTVEWNLLSDWAKTYAPWWPQILNNYKVLVYNGAVDIILGPPAAEMVYNQIPWNGQATLKAAQRKIWMVEPTDVQVAGYVKQAGNLTYAAVRLAGHMVPSDQPRSAHDLITRFINGRSFD